MTTFIIWFLTAVLVIDCVFLILLVLVQLPKKEAGAGLAFGGAATDALFGAGSGTALTKITKYAAGIFFGVTLILTIVSKKGEGISDVEERLKQKSSKPAAAAPANPSIPANPSTPPPGQPIEAPATAPAPTPAAPK